MPSTRSSQGNNEWSEEQTLQLLRLYRDRPWLWNVSDPHYSSRKLRIGALKDIAEAIGIGLTCTQISKKLRTLRAHYRQEERRIKRRAHAGTELKWFSFAHSFLKDAKPTNDDDDMEDDDGNAVLDDAGKVDPEKGNDRMPKSEFVDIKLEQDVDSQSTTNSENGLWEDLKGSNEESLRFVSVLRTYPVFWKLPVEGTETIDQNEYENALEEISRLLQLSKEFLKNRLKSYRFSYQQEIEKIKTEKNYKPYLVWWPLVEEYVDTQEQTKTENKTADSGEPTLNANQVKSYPTLDQNTTELPEKKKRKKKSKPYSLKENHIWSLKDNVKFVRLYGAHPCLWDQNNHYFSSTKMRNAAHEDIAAAMGSGLDADFVAKRIQTVRMLYMKHRKRMIEDIKENRMPSFKTLLWFPLADSFLRPHTGLRSIKKEEREVPQFDYQYVYKHLYSIDPALLDDLNVGCT